jgi:RNA polymerase sigma-70 factor (ECF subfamily)
VNDAELIQRAMQGEAAAWEPLVQEHQEAVFRLAYLYLGDPDEAQDVAQEAFVRAYRALHRYDPARPLRPWILSIAANLARNHRRAAGRYLAALRRLVHADPPARISIEERSVQNLEAQALWEAVQRLDETGRQVVYLRYFLELSVEETAEVLGVAAGTVKSRLHRALARLRTLVEREFPVLLEGREP